MKTLKEKYRLNNLVERINILTVETNELDALLLETIDQEQINKLQIWFGHLDTQVKQFGLASLAEAITEAQSILSKSSGMLGTAEKVKSWMPFVDDMGTVVAFATATLNLIQEFENILKTITGQTQLTDEQKTEPLKIVLDGKLIGDLQKAVGASLATPGLLGVFGKKAPFIGDKIVALTSELIENSYEDLLDFGKQFPDKLPIEKEDAEKLAAGTKDEEAADSAVVDSTEQGGETKGDASDMSPSDELDKISDSNTSPKAAIVNALNSWVDSDEVLKKAFSDDPAITSDMKKGIYNAIDKAADGMASEIDKAMDAWFDKHGMPLVQKGLPNKPFGELIDAIGKEVAELIKNQKAESMKYRITHDQIYKIVDIQLNKKFSKII